MELLPEGPAGLQADSLVTLLTQALHSQDKHLLERWGPYAAISVLLYVISAL